MAGEMRQWTDAEIIALIRATVPAPPAPPPPPEPRKPWTVNDIVTIIGALSAAGAVLMGAWNHNKITTVQDHQVVTEQKQDAVKVALDDVTKTTDDKLKKIEKSAAAAERVENKMMATIPPKSPPQ